MTNGSEHCSRPAILVFSPGLGSSCVRREGSCGKPRKEGDSAEGWLLTGFAASICAFAATMWFYDTLSFVQNVFMLFILLGLSAAFLEFRKGNGGSGLDSRPAD